MPKDKQIVIRQTKDWIESIVIDLNLCPFASNPFQENNIEYTVNFGASTEQHLHQLADCFSELDATADIETSLLIYPDTYPLFDTYLDLLDLANHLLEDRGYEGTYQIASFHPNYRFEDSSEDDASNFSNRSPYPMLHILRESSLEKAIDSHPNIEQVPEKNIKKLRDIGYQKLSQKLNTILREQL